MSTVREIAVGGDKVYVGGEFSLIGYDERRHLAVFDTSSNVYLPLVLR